MRTLCKFLGAGTIATALVGGSLMVLPGDQAAQAKPPYQGHPHMHAALRDLHHAQHQLKEAAHDYGGHRTAALAAVDEAIRQVEAGLHYERK